MDKKMLIDLVTVFGWALTLILFVIILCVLCVAFGPSAPKSPEMTCNVMKGATLCHF